MQLTYAGAQVRVPGTGTAWAMGMDWLWEDLWICGPGCEEVEGEVWRDLAWHRAYDATEQHLATG